ncbi:DUF397 domain-containing protein [Amycolatopsis cihanbeyliensis]|uniref:Uncharacterized protein DUF397 n=1 Tax=Amycolatopsis cihanbeyliensis TaxID=1128664 RepID=A0A542DIV7_AMYCI|nr:DUF397 domain-containing protein [Amycolatopsis cihanbeyliensis]TQJ03000.1 uncharacterized protein DUF397 [Amycolatopsis cihanbeyliensis]
MTAPDLSQVIWRKSSFSTSEANCVEVGFAPGAIAVRDTKDRDRGTLAFPAASWAAFLRTQR